MKLQNVRFLNGGYCWQFNYFTGRPSNPRNSAAPCRQYLSNSNIPSMGVVSNRHRAMAPNAFSTA